ncbi:nucleotidyltransferase domain-containing protein [Alteribacillus sp. HJP-4]|uniref:nucleotidyltransferase domain-containing protein n=1 Tax=Alteribacillus sp. HJP-4 TaxID=2775394 RepID=UPI0035CD36E3
MKQRTAPPLQTARLFIDKFFPECDAALLAGSVVRGETTKTSDLDIVIFDETLKSSYRESFFEFGWPIELFAHSFTTYQAFIEKDCGEGVPMKARMLAEGIILKGEKKAAPVKEKAQKRLVEGPAEWSDETIRIKRYFITDALDDFLGAEKRDEELCIANTLFELLHEFVLRTNRRWAGKSKGIIRALEAYDPDFTDFFVQSFEAFYRHGKKQMVVSLVEQMLSPYGGKLFAGFSSGKDEENEPIR